MKKIYLLSIILCSSLLFSACDTETNENGEKGQSEENTQSGSYKLFVEGTLISEGTIDEVGMSQGLDRTYKNTVSMSEGTIMNILISGFPYTVGESIAIEEDSDPGVTFSGWDIYLTDREEFYFSKSGTITRTSAIKISFEGTCCEMLSTDTLNFNGYYESEAFAAIK